MYIHMAHVQIWSQFYRKWGLQVLDELNAKFIIRRTFGYETKIIDIPTGIFWHNRIHKILYKLREFLNYLISLIKFC